MEKMDAGTEGEYRAREIRPGKMQRFSDPGESLKIACCSVWVYQVATVHFIREKVKPGLFLFFLFPEDCCVLRLKSTPCMRAEGEWET